MNKNDYKSLRQKLDFNFHLLMFLKQVTIDLSLLTGIIFLFQTSYGLLNIALIPLFMLRQFSVLHEAVHGLAHPDDKANELIGFISGIFCLTPYHVWKAAHLKHHYWTGNLEQDPTFTILKQFNQFSDSKKRLIEFTWKKGLPLLSALQHLGFWIFGFKKLENLKNIFKMCLPVGFYIAVLSQATLANAATALLGIFLYFRLYEEIIIPQHVGLYSDDEPDHHPAAWDQPAITRSWYLGAALEKLVVLNMNYHTEHHLFPDLPWHQLDKAHRLLLEQKENINIVSTNWMTEQRNRLFADVIIPVPSRKKNAA